LNAGRIAAWKYRNVSQAILGPRGWLALDAVDSQAVEGATNLAYDLGTRLVEWVQLAAGIPVGFWRSVGSSINAFAVASMMDQLALAARVEAFKFRENHVANSPCFQAVLHAADVMNPSWWNSLPPWHWHPHVAILPGCDDGRVVTSPAISARSDYAKRLPATRLRTG